MTARTLLIDLLLAITVLCAWIGVVGMLRVKSPVQALHFLSVPGATGAGALTLAIFLQVGFVVLAWKMLLIAAVLFAINSVVSHATARAFRVREKGSWQHRHGDDMELIDEHASTLAGGSRA